MNTSRKFQFLGVVSALALLSACEEGALNTKSPDAATDEPQTMKAMGPQIEIREVEREDIFGVTENALWDGRPSLGGVWVAHPDVSAPERVMIRNTSNGLSIAGALFRRERANPGPRIQLSSDAAAALRILAGQPTELNVVAVRREEIEIAPPPDAEPKEPENAPVEENAPKNDTSTETSDDDAAATAAIAAAGIAAAEETPEKVPFWKRFRESLRNDPKPDAVAEADELPDTTDSAAVPDIETNALDPVAGAEAAIENAEAAAVVAVAPAPARPSKPAADGLKNPYVQVGLFSVEMNANSAAANLRQGGIVPTIQETASDGDLLWRVIVGPITTADDQQSLLKQIQELGYKDAYLTAN